MAPVAIPTALDLKYEMAMAVAIAEAPMLTRLFPIRMVVSNVWEFSFICIINRPVLVPSLEIWSAFTLLIEKSAVSDDEKKPERKRQMINKVSSMVNKVKLKSF